MNSMTLQEALRSGIKILSPAADHRDSAALDAEILLAHALGVEREWLYMHSDEPMPRRSRIAYRGLLARRSRHEPVAYILGEKEFFGLTFAVNRHVLIPRPETETLVELVLSNFQIPTSRFQIIDVGTGSGAIAIALAKNLPKAKIIATDTSSKALEVARANARRHGVSKRIRFLRSNLLPTHYSLLTTAIVANLPYLPTAIWKKTAPEIQRYEPRAALDGGPRGLRHYRQLIPQISKLNSHFSFLIFEIDPHQARTMLSLIRKQFPKRRARAEKDLRGKNRFIIIS